MKKNYRTSIPGKFSLGGDYLLVDDHQIGIIASAHLMPFWTNTGGTVIL